MKKLGLVLATATVFCLVVAAPALAKYPPEVEGTSGGNAGGSGGGGGAAGGAAGTAFTGVDVSLWMVLLAVLAVAGVTALILSRRRAAASK
jgi:hypothetical protein